MSNEKPSDSLQLTYESLPCPSFRYKEWNGISSGLMFSGRKNQTSVLSLRHAPRRGSRPTCNGSAERAEKVHGLPSRVELLGCSSQLQPRRELDENCADTKKKKRNTCVGVDSPAARRWTAFTSVAAAVIPSAFREAATGGSAFYVNVSLATFTCCVNFIRGFTFKQ
jgi:hypothetical protein